MHVRGGSYTSILVIYFYLIEAVLSNCPDYEALGILPILVIKGHKLCHVSLHVQGTVNGKPACLIYD